MKLTVRASALLKYTGRSQKRIALCPYAESGEVHEPYAMKAGGLRGAPKTLSLSMRAAAGRSQGLLQKSKRQDSVPQKRSAGVMPPPRQARREKRILPKRSSSRGGRGAAVSKDEPRAQAIRDAGFGRPSGKGLSCRARIKGTKACIRPAHPEKARETHYRPRAKQNSSCAEPACYRDRPSANANWGAEGALLFAFGAYRKLPLRKAGRRASLGGHRLGSKTSRR